MIPLAMKSSEVYQAQASIVHLAQEELDFLARSIDQSPRKRCRICTHRSVAESLHEMFVIYSKATYVRPNRHFGKDESVFVIRGSADFVFFDDAGAVTHIVPMGDTSTDSAYYCRVPAKVYHTLIIRSDQLVLFEATPGPFNPADTAYADWAPPESDTAAVAGYMEWLNRQIVQNTRVLAQ